MALQDWIKALVRHQTGLAENAAQMVTSGVAEVPAGIAEIVGFARDGVNEGGQRAQKVRDALTYQPRSRAAKAQQGQLARFIAPVAERIERGRNAAGNWTLERTGSPAAATAVAVLPEALMTLAGAPGASRGLSTVARNAARMEAPAMGSPAAQLGIFAGPKAATADIGAMNRAASRLALGADPREVWRTEGWFKGPDGKMRFEIDDSQSRFNSEPLAAPLNEALDHPQLNAAYNLSDVAVTIDPHSPYGGSFDTRGGDAFMEVRGPQADHRSIGLHETQHAIQRREGFARGGNVQGLQEEMDAARARLAYLSSEPEFQQAMGFLDEREPLAYDAPDVESALERMEREARERFPAYAQAQEEQNLLRQIRDPREAYNRLAGEAEARAVQKRMDYTPAQRRAVYPLDDYDVPLDELIIRGNR